MIEPRESSLISCSIPSQDLQRFVRLKPTLISLQSRDFYDSVKFMDDYVYKQIESHKDGPDLMSQFINLKDQEGNAYPKVQNSVY